MLSGFSPRRIRSAQLSRPFGDNGIVVQPPPDDAMIQHHDMPAVDRNVRHGRKPVEGIDGIESGAGAVLTERQIVDDRIRREMATVRSRSARARPDR